VTAGAIDAPRREDRGAAQPKRRRVPDPRHPNSQKHDAASKLVHNVYRITWERVYCIYKSVGTDESMTRFSWDEQKNRANRRKHGVSFETATLVFSDPNVIFAQDREVDGEPRWQAIGKAGDTVLLLVAHAYEEDDGGETIRIISARRAEPEEFESYSQQFEPRGYER
jgi:uncharacterized DUF497 family protein